LAYIISDKGNPTNHPIYAVDTDFGACFLQIEESQLASMQLKKLVCQITEEEGPQIWDMFFDEAFYKESVGAGVVLVSHTQECIDSYFILTFQVNKTFQAKHPRLKPYRDEVKYRPSLPDKVKCCNFFKEDDQINRLLQVFYEFYVLWRGPLVISQVHMSNIFILHNLEGGDVFGSAVNGLFLKLISFKALKPWYCKYVFPSFYFIAK